MRKPKYLCPIWDLNSRICGQCEHSKIHDHMGIACRYPCPITDNNIQCCELPYTPTLWERENTIQHAHRLGKEVVIVQEVKL